MTIFIDQDARDSIDSAIEETLFVEAGAGVGKTHHLVRRVITLLHSGIPVDKIAAITFTEKASAELRDRLRRDIARSELLSSEKKRAALDGLDSAPLGTIHAFAARILEQNPIEVGLPPAIEVIDELRAGIAFSGRWARARTALFQNIESARALQVLLAAGASLQNLEQICRELDRSWDRVRDAPPAVLEAVVLDLGPIIRQAQLLWERRAECSDDSDKLFVAFPILERTIRALKFARDSNDLELQIEALAGVKLPPRNVGSGKAWLNSVSVKDDILALRTAVDETRGRVIDTALSRVTSVLGDHIVTEAAARRQHGQLEYHDLLVLSRDLLVGDHAAEPHRRLHESYQRILLDEFQDTDPLQAELAVRIAADSVLPKDGWESSASPAARLFMVGDPKQSIYRFRRADIATYLQQGERVTSSPGGREISLTTNFRSTRPVLEWTNTAFGQLIKADGYRQPGYTPLESRPERPKWAKSGGPPVVIMQGGDDDDSSQERFRREGDAAASAILRAVGAHPEAQGQTWLIEKIDHAGAVTHRAPKFSDICVLIPTRTSLPRVEEALDAAGIDFVAESSSLVYSTREVADLLLAIRAIANTADEAALVLALRTPLFSCGDDELLTWKAGGGSWNLTASIPSILEHHRVALAVTYLKSLLEASRSLSVGDVLAMAVRDLRIRQVVTDTPRFRDVWRRIRFVIDQAQAWSDATHGSLRDYVVWAEFQQDERARVAESTVPEEGLDAVRITTIHAAKGREFPIVALVGMAAGWLTTRPSLLWSDDGRPLISVRSGFASSGYEKAYTDEQNFIAAERVRQLYVACTRAESHLIVSGYRGRRRASWGDLLAPGIDQAGGEKLDVKVGVVASQGRKDPDIGAVLPLDEWRTQRLLWEKTSAKLSSISVTAIAKATSPSTPSGIADANDPVGTPLRVMMFDETARHGTKWGIAVHRVLELSNLSADADLAAISNAVAQAAGLQDAPLLETMARNALLSAPVTRAATRKHWMELPVGAQRVLPDLGEVVVEGVIDLLYREDDGSLVIVDFKTNVGISEPKTQEYWQQLEIYADLVQAASGEVVSSLELVYCRDSPATVRTRKLTAVEDGRHA